MEYSKNFNFALPSRDNDADLADINELANNFRKIDEEAVKKESGKGLSTNDFTNEQKEKVESSLTKENVDQAYNPTSENAQSGVAVAEALNDVANAVKHTVSGNPIVIDDASPVNHTLDIKTTAGAKVYIRGRNLIPFADKKYNGKYQAGQTYEMNGVNFTINDDGSIYAKGTATKTFSFYLLSTKTLSTGVHTVALSGSPNGSSATTYMLRLRTGEKATNAYNDYGDGVTINNANITKNSIAIIVVSGAIIDATFYPMLEFGNIASDFVSPCESVSATADENGVVSGVKSVAPKISVFTETGTNIECTYNRDTNIVMGDVETALDSIIAMQNALIGGAE